MAKCIIYFDVESIFNILDKKKAIKMLPSFMGLISEHELCVEGKWDKFRYVIDNVEPHEALKLMLNIRTALIESNKQRQIPLAIKGYSCIYVTDHDPSYDIMLELFSTRSGEMNIYLSPTIIKHMDVKEEQFDMIEYRDNLIQTGYFHNFSKHEPSITDDSGYVKYHGMYVIAAIFKHKIEPLLKLAANYSIAHKIINDAQMILIFQTIDESVKYLSMLDDKNIYIGSTIGGDLCMINDEIICTKSYKNAINLCNLAMSLNNNWLSSYAIDILIYDPDLAMGSLCIYKSRNSSNFELILSDINSKLETLCNATVFRTPFEIKAIQNGKKSRLERIPKNKMGLIEEESI